MLCTHVGRSIPLIRLIKFATFGIYLTSVWSIHQIEWFEVQKCKNFRLPLYLFSPVTNWRLPIHFFLFQKTEKQFLSNWSEQINGMKERFSVIYLPKLNNEFQLNVCKVYSKSREFSRTIAKFLWLLRGAHPPSDTPLSAQARRAALSRRLKFTTWAPLFVMAGSATEVTTKSEDSILKFAHNFFHAWTKSIQILVIVLGWAIQGTDDEVLTIARVNLAKMHSASTFYFNTVINEVFPNSKEDAVIAVTTVFPYHIKIIGEYFSIVYLAVQPCFTMCVTSMVSLPTIWW